MTEPRTTDQASTQPARIADPGLTQYTYVMYALHGLAVLIGLTGMATIVGQFLFGVPSLIAVVMNYARRGDAHGTPLESHFRWQLRTFWFALLWVVATAIVCAPLLLVLIGAVLAWIGFGVIGLWVAYRVLRGVLALRDGCTMPGPQMVVT